MKAYRGRRVNSPCIIKTPALSGEQSVALRQEESFLAGWVSVSMRRENPQKYKSGFKLWPSSAYPVN
jgi:hypothetical protein